MKLSEVECRRFRGMFDALEHSMSLIDSEHRYVFVNKAFAQGKQLETEQIQGKHVRDVWGDEVYELYIRPRFNEVFSGEVVEREFSVQNKQGEDLFFEATFSPHYDDDEKVSHVIVIQRNVTDKKQMLKQLHHGDRLESLGVLAGGIAHDFNNILTVITGHATMAKFAAEGQKQLQEHLQYIDDAGHRASLLCRQMLAYAGKGQYEIKLLNLSKLVEDISELLEVTRPKGVEVVYELRHDLSRVNADVAQMQQVLMNLMTNASEAIGEKNGTIIVSSGTKFVDQAMIQTCQAHHHASPGKYVFVRISDNGCGMDEATQQRLYEPFFTTKFKGRGLGMSAILGIVNGHNGLLHVQSARGKGTRITVLLPVAPEAMKES